MVIKMIINLNGYSVMTQSGHPHDNWMGDGWAIVPKEFEALCLENSPFLKLSFDENGEIEAITPDAGARTASTPETPEPDALADLLSLYIDHEYRLTLAGIE